MKGKHFAVIAAALGALAMQIGGLHDWHQALTPGFVSGAVMAVTTAVGGMFVAPPNQPEKSANVVPMPRP